MVNLNELKAFVAASNLAGYASGDSRLETKEPNKSTSIVFEQGDWRSHDNFFGGEPYGGRVVVSYQDQPVWMMVYYGWVEKEVKPDPVYGILREALKQFPPEYPYRGPEQFVSGGLEYQNSWDGEIDRFRGEEEISEGGKRVYFAAYFGGLVDQRIGN